MPWVVYPTSAGMRCVQKYIAITSLVIDPPESLIVFASLQKRG
jgi:hypothetical protein